MDDNFDAPMMDGGFDGGMMDGGGMGEDMGGQPVMDGGMPPMDGEIPNQFDTNFDPGVEADEEQDPKRFIQQLTGKLSQSLHQYNQSLPQPDADLGKYVAGMIIKQATEGLSQEDRSEILDKVNSDEPTEEPQGGEMPQQEMPMDNGDAGGIPPMDDTMPQGQNESLRRNLTEFDVRPGISGNEDDEPKPMKKRIRNSYKTSPFTPKY